MKSVMRVAVEWKGEGEWAVRLETKNNSMPLGTINVTRAGRFVGSFSGANKTSPQSNIELAARDLAREEVGRDEALRLSVALPFADGSGP